MNTKERRNYILKLLQEKKRLFLAALEKELNVSAMTIRRDFHRFTAMGIATPILGGIVYIEGGTALPTILARAPRMKVEKYNIGAYCSSLINEGNAVYLDTGTTAFSIADALMSRKNIAVLSHSLLVQNLLANNDNIQLFGVPGVYRNNAKGYFGDLACRFIRGFRLDIAFLGSSAISIDGGLTSPEVYDQAIKRAIIETARQVVLVVDHTKINHNSFLQVCPIENINIIVTDKHADLDFIAAAKRRGVKVVQV